MKLTIRTARTVIGLALMVGVLGPDALARGQQAAPSDWSRVGRLEPGTEMTVTSRGAGPTKCRAAFADTQNLVVLKFNNPQPPRRVLRALTAVAPDLPSVLTNIDVTSDSVRFSRSGVFDGDIRIADLVQLPREDVVEVQVPGRRGSIRGAVIGTCVGAAVGALTAVSIGLGYCGHNCSVERPAMQRLMALSAVGTPIAGGLLGYYAGGHASAPVTIYRAPQIPPLVLDEATWQRLRDALPLSLRGEGRNPPPAFAHASAGGKAGSHKQ